MASVLLLTRTVLHTKAAGNRLIGHKFVLQPGCRSSLQVLYGTRHQGMRMRAIGSEPHLGRQELMRLTAELGLSACNLGTTVWPIMSCGMRGSRSIDSTALNSAIARTQKLCSLDASMPKRNSTKA